MLHLSLGLPVKGRRGAGAQKLRGAGVQKLRSAGVQELRSAGRLEYLACPNARLNDHSGRTSSRAGSLGVLVAKRRNGKPRDEKEKSFNYKFVSFDIK